MSAKKLSWHQPHEVDEITLAGKANVVGKLLPPMSEIPVEFHRHTNTWCSFAMSLFFKGGALPKCKDGIDPNKAARHLKAVLGSFEPKYEHKEAGAGWLMSLWYEQPEAATA